jgi:hypothetical protein
MLSLLHQSENGTLVRLDHTNRNSCEVFHKNDVNLLRHPRFANLKKAEEIAWTNYLRSTNYHEIAPLLMSNGAKVISGDDSNSANVLKIWDLGRFTRHRCLKFSLEISNTESVMTQISELNKSTSITFVFLNILERISVSAFSRLVSLVDFSSVRLFIFSSPIVINLLYLASKILEFVTTSTNNTTANSIKYSDRSLLFLASDEFQKALSNDKELTLKITDVDKIRETVQNVYNSHLNWITQESEFRIESRETCLFLCSSDQFYVCNSLIIY